MDPEQRSELEEPDQYIVAYIDFDGSSDTRPIIRNRTAELLHEIKMKKYPDEHRLYVLQRIRGSTARDPMVFELLKRRMLQLVDLLKRELLPEHAAEEDEEPPLSDDDSSRRSVPLGWITWSGRTFFAEHGPPCLEDEVVSGSYFWYGPKMYPMSHSSRGMCIIINNCNFNDVSERCDGSAHDDRRMEALFKSFLFNCIVRKDQKADEMKKFLSEAAKSKEHERAQCLVVILMSHGNQDTILGVDGKTLNLVNDVYRKFNNEECPALQGKPKLFFIQACQRQKSDSGASTTVAETADTMGEPAEEPQSGCGSSGVRWVRTIAVRTMYIIGAVVRRVTRSAAPCTENSDSGASTAVADTADAMAEPAEKPHSDERMPSWSDMYCPYAVIPYYDAHINTGIGSWYLSAVFRVFSQYAFIMHLDDLMKQVHEEVRRKSSHGGDRHTLGVDIWGWTKTLYFNPKKFV